MSENKLISQVEEMSLDELVDFFDNEDMSKLWDALPEVEFDIQPMRHKRLFAVDEALAKELVGLAHSKAISTESLVEMFLWEKVREAA